MTDANQSQRRTIQIAPNRRALLLETLPTASANDAINQLGIPPTRFSIVIHGGAADMAEAYQAKLQKLFRDSVVRFAQDNYVLVASGGTQSGAMATLGQAYAAAHATFPLVGVAVRQGVTYPDGPTPTPGHFPLEPNHSHFVIVEGDDFGVESQILVGMAKAFGNYGVALAINGGEVVKNEIEMHAKLGNPVIVCRGTGRYADELADAADDSPLRAAFDEGATLRVFDLDNDSPEALYKLIRSLLLR